MRMLVYAAAAGACLAFGGSIAADFDGSKPLICATTEAMDCPAGRDCFRGRPGQLGAPAFLRIDLAKKTIGGPKRTTSIVSVETSDKDRQILLQGTEIGYGWTLALDTSDGSMSATLVNREGAFVLFGQCTPL